MRSLTISRLARDCAPKPPERPKKAVRGPKKPTGLDLLNPNRRPQCSQDRSAIIKTNLDVGREATDPKSPVQTPNPDSFTRSFAGMTRARSFRKSPSTPTRAGAASELP